MSENKWKLEETLESKSNFETRKVLNRSTVSIPKDLIESIELNGIISETLETVKIPIFRYKTQLTLHGVFSELHNDRIGGYKNLIVNGNKTLGVRYNAIDYEKKMELFNALRIDGNYKTWNYNRNSTEFYANITHTARNRDEINAKIAELVEMQKRIDSSLFVGTKNIYKYFHPWYGYMAELVLNIGTIRAENVGKLFENITGKNYNEFKIAAEQKEQEENRIENEKRLAREQKKKEEMEKRINAVKSLGLREYRGGTGFYVQPLYSEYDERYVATLVYVYSNKSGTCFYTKGVRIATLDALKDKENFNKLSNAVNIHKDKKLSDRTTNDRYSITI